MTSSWLWQVLAACYILVELVSKAAVTRFIYRVVTLFFCQLELLMMRLMQLIWPPRFVLLGECHRCGRCCQHLLATPPSFVRRTFLLQIFLFYHRVLHRFVPVGTIGEDSLVLGCGHQRADQRCGIYWKRPFLCRNYPLRPYFTPPDLMSGCGFRFAPRVVAAMRRRSSLPIVNPGTTVLHPTREKAKEDQPEDYTWVDDTAFS